MLFIFIQFGQNTGFIILLQKLILKLYKKKFRESTKFCKNSKKLPIEDSTSKMNTNTKIISYKIFIDLD